MPAVDSSRKLKFGPFELDSEAGELTRNGIKLKLQIQPLQVLIALLDRPGELVAREELCRRLWPNGTYVDFDNSLNAAVNRLRHLLGDSSENPEFIETVPRRGYRFIAPVEAVEEKALVAETPQPTSRSTWKIWIAVLTIVLLVGASTLSLHRAPVLDEKDQILLADFVNTTHDDAFDNTLKQALAVELEQSPFLNIVPERRVREVLKLMARGPAEPVSGELAREICEREGIRAMISGSVASFGKNYAITLQVSNCHTGEPISLEQVEVGSKEEVLRALRKAGVKTRKKLGESLASIQRFDVPLENATTPSLEALKFFTLGSQQRDQGKEGASIAFFRHATELDPKFALAYARLGQVYRNLDESEQAKRSATRAYQLRDGVSERERLYIDSRYHAYVSGDQQKEIDTYDLWMKTYPKDINPYLFLAGIYRSNGEWQKAADLAEQATRINPDHPFPRLALGSAYAAMNRFEQARGILEKPAAYTIWTPAVLYKISFAKGDTAAMQRCVDSAAGKPEALELMFSVAAGEAAKGNLRSARRLLHETRGAAEAMDLKELAAKAIAGEAFIEALTGNVRQARKTIEELRPFPDSAIPYEHVGWIHAASGNIEASQKVIDMLSKNHVENTYVNFVWMPAARAEIHLARGNNSAAILDLETAKPYELGAVAGFFPAFIRGRAYLQGRKDNEAILEFRRILEHQGVDPTSMLYVLSFLYAGRSYSQLGDTGRSREAYQEFLALWKDADTDVPILKQAKAEYAKLK